MRTLSIALVLSLPTASPAQVLLQTGFESAAFATGVPVDGRDGWVGFFAPGISEVSATGAREGRRCVKLHGADLAFARPGLVAGTIGPELHFDPVAAKRTRLHIRADVKLEGPDTGEGPLADLASANLFVVSESSQTMGGFFVSSNGTIYAFGRGGQEYMFPTPYVAGRYARLEIDLDFEAMTNTFWVDGRAIGTLDLDPLGTLVSKRIWTSALELAALDDPWVLDRSLYHASFDNVLVSAAPGKGPR